MLNLQINQFSRRLIFSSAADLPVITMPLKFKERVTKIRKKIEEKDRKRWQERRMSGDKAVPIVSCKNELFNHYKGQSYRSEESIPLASRRWVKKNSAGDYFTLNSYSGNPAFSVGHDNEEYRVKFENLGLRPELVQRLQACDVRTPTKIQELAIPPILKGSNSMCAAETGSGKTMAYVLPILSNIMDIKGMMNRENNPSSPLALILVPGRELVHQIQNVIALLTESLSINTSVHVGGLGTKRLMLDPPVHDVDIVVSTLGVMKKMVSSGVYNIRDVRHLVIDEADTMLDDSFSFEINSFLDKFKFRNVIPADPADPNVGPQLLMVGATMPQSLGTVLSKNVAYNSIHHVSTPHLHRLMPHVPQKFIRLKKSEKPARLLQILKPQVNRKQSVMVFSKDASTCDFVQMFMEENGIKSLNLNGLLPAKLRVGRFQKFQDGLCSVLSCTDLGSRGLDTIKVQHVINYDFPQFMSDYIHRAGRVGRVGSCVTGHVTNFVSAPWEVDLVQKIEMAARKTQTLPNVDANIKKVLLSNLGDAEDLGQ